MVEIIIFAKDKKASYNRPVMNKHILNIYRSIFLHDNEELNINVLLKLVNDG